MSSDERKEVRSVPVIDIGALMACESDTQVEATLQDPAGPFGATIAALRAAATEWGFFYIVNHGVSPAQLKALRSASRDFFALDKATKNRVRRTAENSRGYFDDELTKNKRDWKEVFDVTGPHEDAPPDPARFKRLLSHEQNQWLDDDALPGFKQTITVHHTLMEHISRRLLMLFAVALGEHATFFDQFFHDKHDSQTSQSSPESENAKSLSGGPVVHANSSLFRLNYYPVAPDPESTMGVYHHTDPGALTVLLQDDQVASLQVFHRKSQEWHFIPPIPNTFVVNIGDLVQIWSNDKFIAPLHRVLANGAHERYSAPFFHNPSYDTVVQPIVVASHETPKYKPLHWFAYLRERIEGNFSDIGEDIQISHFCIHSENGQ